MTYITGHPDVDKYLLLKMLDYKTLSILNSANKYAKRNLKRMNIIFEADVPSNKLPKKHVTCFTDKFMAACSSGSLNFAKFLLNTSHHHIDITTKHKYHCKQCSTYNISYVLNDVRKQQDYALNKSRVNPRNIFYKQQRFPMFKAFVLACENGHINVMQWLWNISNKKIDLHVKNEFEFVLGLACKNGHIHIAQWLWYISNETINIHANNEYPFTAACDNEHLDIVQWLWDTSKHTIDFQMDDHHIFRRVCVFNKSLDVAKWILNASNGTISEHIINNVFKLVCWAGKRKACEWLFSVSNSIDARFNNDELFHKACLVGDHDIAKFLWRISNKSIHFDHDNVFIRSCERNDPKMAQWLWEAFGQSMYVNHDYIFIQSCLKNNKDIAEWFCTLSDNYSIVCVGNRIVPVIKSYVAMLIGSCLAIYLASHCFAS